MPEFLRKYDSHIITALFAVVLALGAWVVRVEARTSVLETTIEMERTNTHSALKRIETKVDSINEFLRAK